MADREVQLIDKDDEHIYPLGHSLDEYILALPDNQDPDNHIKDFTGATSSEKGKHGLVFAPSAGDENKVLEGDKEWSAYPLGCILDVAEYNAEFGRVYNQQSLTAIGGTWNHYGIIGASGSSVAITPPNGEGWTIECQLLANHLYMVNNNTDTWAGIGLKYTRTDGASGNFASNIKTVRGFSVTTNAKHYSIKCVKRGYCPANVTTTIIPAYVSYCPSPSYAVYTGSGTGGWNNGPTFVLIIRLISKTKA